ncbi:carboxylate-amine ligase [Agromyces soli]
MRTTIGTRIRRRPAARGNPAPSPGRRPADGGPRLGIEEEMLLVDPVSLAPANVGAALLGELSHSPSAVAQAIMHEFLECQLEYATPVCDRVEAAGPLLREARRVVDEAGAALGVVPVSTGTPFRAVREPVLADDPRYRRIGDEIAGLLAEHQVCGMHLHLGYDDPEQRVEALNRLCAWVPVFTALAANSPFWNGRDTGFASWRTVLLRRWLAIGVPERFAGLADYERRRGAVLAAAGADDPALVTWTLRLSHHLPTVELRFGDAQLEVDDTLAICGFVRLVATRLMRDRRPTLAPAGEVLDTAVWTAARHGHAARLPDPLGGAAIAPVAQLVDSALDWAEAGPTERARMHALLARGSGASRQRAAWRAGGVPALAQRLRAAARPGIAPHPNPVKPDAPAPAAG